MLHENLSSGNSEVCIFSKPAYWKELTVSGAEHDRIDPFEIIILPVAGMPCGANIDNIRNSLKRVNGIVSAHLVFADTAARIRYDTNQEGVDSIIAALLENRA